MVNYFANVQYLENVPIEYFKLISFFPLFWQWVEMGAGCVCFHSEFLD